MKTLAIVLFLAVLIGGISFAYAQAKTYKYKCPHCDRVAEYSSPQAAPKCPSGDGWIMVPMN
jgi:hypothetical protein